MNVAATGLTGSLLSSSTMRAVFSDAAWIDALLSVEAALAGAQGKHGVIDADVASDIVACCNVAMIDAEQLTATALSNSGVAAALVQQLSALVAQRNEAAASYVHWGAATHDLIDTAMVLRLRAALDLIDTDLARLVMLLAQRADIHRQTLQVGRTGLQHAGPVSFGLKVAGWLDGMLRHQERLQQLRTHLLVLQFGGLTGTLASQGKSAQAVAQSMAATLQLDLPDLPWHSQRDRFAEFATTLGLLTGSLGKMARDIALLMQTEVAELAEPLTSGRVTTAGQPYRRTPAGCAMALVAAQRVPPLVASMLSGMVQEHERGLGNWQAEWDTLPQIVQLCAAALEQMRLVATVMIVDATRMRTNLDATRGQVMAEALALALTRKIGRSAAYAMVEQVCQQANRSGLDLRAELEQHAGINAALTPLELDRLLEPAGYQGQAAEFVNRVLQRQRQRHGLTAPQSTAALPLTDSHNVHLHYEIEGDIGAPILVLSNSLGTSLQLWAPQMPALLEHFRVLRYDARGHGQSGVPDGPYSIADMGADVIALLDHLGIAQAHFCGISMGGMVGMWLATHHAARIDHLVLSNTAAILGPPEVWDKRIEQVEQGGMNSIVNQVVERWFTRDFQAHAVRQIGVVRDMLLQTSDAGYIASCIAVRDADLRDDLVKIQAPTLVIGGKQDKATPSAQCRKLAEQIPNARYIELNAAHLANWEVAQGFTRQVIEFLRGRT